MDNSLIEGDVNESVSETSMLRKQAEATVSEKLKKKESQPLKEKILNFIRDVQNQKFPKDKLPSKVTEMIEEVEEEFQALWNENEDVVQENGEFFEKIITKPLHPILMTLFDEQRDKNLEFSFKVFDFIKLKHLETAEEVGQHHKFEFVVKQLSKIDSYAAPREKLQCIMNGCKMITIVNSYNKNNSPTGADHFLPVLIYAVLQARPSNPFSNIEYISNFRSSRRISGPEEYYFTAFESALEFIESLDHNQLKINAEEFKKLCSERVEGIKYDEQLPDDGQFQFDAYQNYINLQMMRFKLQEVQKTAKLQNISKKQKLKFQNKQMSEISLSELPDFYKEYQLLYKNHQEIQKQLDGIQQYTDSIIKESDNQRNNKKEGKKFFGLL